MSLESSNYVAGGTIRPSRFVFPDSTTDHRVVEGTANAEVDGVSQSGTNRVPLSDIVSTSYAAIVGEQVKVYGLGSFCLIEAGDAIANGEYLKSDSVGRAVKIATTGTTIQNFGAKALATASAAGELIPAQIIIGKTRPALT